MLVRLEVNKVLLVYKIKFYRQISTIHEIDDVNEDTKLFWKF